MADGPGGPREPGTHVPAGNDAAELASRILEFLHQLRDIPGPIAQMAADHLSNNKSFHDAVAAEFDADPPKFGNFERNYILQELAEDIKASGPYQIAMQLATKAYPSASGATISGDGRPRFVVEYTANMSPPGGRLDRFSALADRVSEPLSR